MIDYDPSSPLISIHIPKTGGVSIRNIYQGWFKEGYLTHYRGAKGELPKKHELSQIESAPSGVLIHGHFNKVRGFGIEEYYPEVNQFITILRDPFDRAVSRYFYLNHETIQNKDSLRESLLAQNPAWSMFCHFPEEVTMENFKVVIDENFIEIGLLEYMEESLNRISRKLNKNYDIDSLAKLNISRKSLDTPHELRDLYVANNPLEYAVYNYILERYL